MPPFHPRNRHQGRYAFDRLVAAHPELSKWLVRTPRDEVSVDFAEPGAVLALNAALLASQYGISDWSVPEGYLCPPIPGRADYIHAMADLLAVPNGGEVPTGDVVTALDVGVGASGIYPIVGRSEYGWRFVASDVDDAALASTKRILEANAGLRGGVELRKQGARDEVLRGVIRTGERIDLVVCNPPFHASATEAAEGSARKWRNLGKAPPRALNFGGHGGELWCPGGEAAFAGRMIAESAAFGKQLLWCSVLISKEANVPAVHRALKAAGVVENRTVRMEQGQKTSRLIAWSFLDPGEQRDWCAGRFANFRDVGQGRIVRHADPLAGRTLEAILTQLVEDVGWDGLAREIEVRCFTFDPSVASSLVFLRRTPWARKKVEELYLRRQKRAAKR
jgi:23S rRNA (adenine1618-N6)-methyltransferase